MKIDSSKPLHWLLLAKQGIYTLIAVALRFFRAKPAKPIVLLYGHQFSGNLKALYTQWALSHRSSFEFYYLSLDPVYSVELKTAGVDVLQCNSLKDMLKLSQASALISDHGLHAMAPLLRLSDIVFIDVWHGIPFKGFTPEDFRVQHQYDEVWVSSPLLKQLYQDQFGFAQHKVYDLGYARTDKLFKCQRPASDIRETLQIPATHKIVLYAPTWQQDDEGRTMYPFEESETSFLQALDDICISHSATLVIRNHLNSEIEKLQLNNVEYCSQKDFPDSEDLLLQADILICDWSSIAFDYLALGRPTLFLDVPAPFKNGFSLGKEFRFGKIVEDMASLNRTIAIYLENSALYQVEHGELATRISDQVYGDNNDGLAAHRQLERLETLV